MNGGFHMRQWIRPNLTPVMAIFLAFTAVGVGVASARNAPTAARPRNNPQARTNGKIAFGRWFPALDDFRIFTINPDGSDERPLLKHKAEDPVFSPDGRKIAVTLTGPRGPASATVNPDGSGLNRLTPRRPTLRLSCQAWSPNGRRLACTGYGRGGRPSRYGMYTIRASDGRKLRQVTTHPNGTPDDGQGVNDVPIGYSANGSRILFERNHQNDLGRLFTVRTGGTNLRRLMPKSLAVQCCHAGWSPDGSRVAFAAYRKPRQPRGAVFVVKANGTRLRRITPSHLGALNAQWSPDGRFIAFNSLPPRALSQIYLVRPSGNGLRKLTSQTSGYGSFSPVWSPDGAKLAFRSCNPDIHRCQAVGLWTINANGTGLFQLTDPALPHFDSRAAWGSSTSPAAGTGCACLGRG
jgi:Tol biopolymer transport system component